MTMSEKVACGAPIVSPEALGKHLPSSPGEARVGRGCGVGVRGGKRTDPMPRAAPGLGRSLGLG